MSKKPGMEFGVWWETPFLMLIQTEMQIVPAVAVVIAGGIEHPEVGELQILDDDVPLRAERRLADAK